MSNKQLKHIGIILDGNRRWAKENNLTTYKGHLRGYENMKTIARYWLSKSNGNIMTVYAFSTENWKRKQTEVNYLMKLLRKAVSEEADELNNLGIKVNILGLRKGLAPDILKAIDRTHEITKNNKKGIFNICINYGGHIEIVETIKQLAKDNYNFKNLTPEKFAKHLWTKSQPYPDLIIRTSGEQRLSNFLTWQSSYSELYFPKKHWPAFTEKDLDKAINEYNNRNRRFGGN